jgi:aminopeptidase N
MSKHVAINKYAHSEGILLVDPENTPIGRVQQATQVISHELTHQWFGNIVSPEWWSDLWLNEGFATYFEFFGTAQVYLQLHARPESFKHSIFLQFYPQWLMDQQFQSDMMHSVFVTDASIFGSHPVHNEVDSPQSIDSMFDNMSYNKGGCLVRFMLNLLGENNFRNGIINYMNQK